MAFTRQYKSFLRPEKRVPRSQIRPRNIYRITTYRGGEPATKSGEDARYIFVIGIVGNKVHAIKLNPIQPIHFTNFIGSLRDRRIPIGSDQALELLLKRFSKDGSSLFESKIKNNSKIYSRSLSNYRTYILNSIVNVYEIRFEEDVLRRLFGEPGTSSTRRQVLQDEINEDSDDD
tara:strand:- start:10608 stop:11132 length:525 start_codon:yes stop_codon:yes gene_type:complete